MTCLILVGLLEVCIEVILGDFLDDFCEIGFLKLRCGWNRYAVPSNQTFVLECKLTGDTYRTNVLKHTIIVQYYIMFFGITCFLFIFAT